MAEEVGEDLAEWKRLFIPGVAGLRARGSRREGCEGMGLFSFFTYFFFSSIVYLGSS